MHSRALTFAAGFAVTLTLAGGVLLLPAHPPYAARPTGGRNPGTTAIALEEWFNMKQQRDQAFQAFAASVQQHHDMIAALADAARQTRTPRPGRTLRILPTSSGGTTTPTGTDEAAFAACVIAHESGGNPTAVNPSSGAAGKYQYLPSTWNGYGGYASAAQAPAAVQDAKFHATYAGGAGARHWHGTGCPGS